MAQLAGVALNWTPWLGSCTRPELGKKPKTRKHCLLVVKCWLKTTLKKKIQGVPLVAQWAKNPTSVHKDADLISSSAQRVKGSSTAVSCDVGCRHGLDLALLWLWYRLTATAPIWTPSLGTSTCCRCGPKKTKRKKQKRKRKIRI